MPIREAGGINGIPSSSLRGHVYGTTTHRKKGKMGVLTDAEEEEIGRLSNQNTEFRFSSILRKITE